MKKEIGLPKNKINIDQEIYFYFFYDNETNSNSEPIKSKITGGPYVTSMNDTCMIEDISGVVSLTHISENYYPEEYNKKPKNWRSKERYLKFINNDGNYSYAEFIGVPKQPSLKEKGYKFDESILYSYVDEKMGTEVKSNWFSNKNDALFDYKLKRKQYLKDTLWKRSLLKKY